MTSELITAPLTAYSLWSFAFRVTLNVFEPSKSPS